MMPLVYEAMNSLTGDKYVGVTKFTLGHRAHRHNYFARRRLSNMRFHRAIRKYGDMFFTWKVLKEFPTYAEALAAEQSFIAEIKPAYNSVLGGRGAHGLKRTDKWKRDMSARFKGKKLAPEGLLKAQAIIRAGLMNKSVMCLTDVLFFKSGKAAIDHYGFSKGRMSTVCKRREFTIDGRHFCYAERPMTKDECDAEIADRQKEMDRRNVIRLKKMSISKSGLNGQMELLLCR